MAYIYKISCKDLNVKECYFGSTIDFKTRKSRHKSNCSNENSDHYNIPLYQFIRQNNGWDNWTMQIIDCITSIDKKIYEKCERTYIEENRDIVLNKEIPGRTDNEYYQDNKEKIIEYQKVWYQDNKEKEILRHKIYYENNKEIIREKENIYKKQKITCPRCLKIVTRGALYNHQSRLTCQLNKCLIID